MLPEQQAQAAILAGVEALRDALAALSTQLGCLALASSVEAVRAELQSLRAELATGQMLPVGALQTGTPLAVAAAATALPEQLVTLDQIGAMVHRSKRSMERYRRQMPAPRVQGRRGRSHLWAWPEVRPWLEATFSLQLPERFPGLSH
jgi:hypothetical protein